MSSYLDSPDSDNEGEAPVTLDEEQRQALLALVQECKQAGNDHFGKSEYDEALQKYTDAVNMLKSNHLPKDALILLNRSATYLALQRYVPALNDANQGW